MIPYSQSNSPRNNESAGPSTSETGPDTLGAVSTAERFIIQSVRAMVMGAPAGIILRQANRLFCAEISHKAVERIADLVTAMDDPNGPLIRLRKPSCARLEDDERVILRLLSALHRQDLDTAKVYCDLLVSPFCQQALLSAGTGLVDALDGDQIRFTCHAPIPQMAWGLPDAAE